MSHRVQAILEAAEQAARDIRYEAEMEKRRTTRESDRRIAEVDDGLRRMAAVADALVERADELRRQVDEMIGALRRAEAEPGAQQRHEPAAASRPRFTGSGARPRSERRAAEPQAPPAAEPPPPPAAEPPPPRYEAPAMPAPEQAYEQPAAEPAELGPERLVAIQMAMAGRSREEAAERLVRGFGLQDPNAILDEVFE